MSRRNLILIVIILVILTAGFFAYLYFREPATTIPDEGGTNFFSDFNPFGQSSSKPTATTPPEDISGYEPDELSEAAKKLTRVSNVPVAGYTLFLKERYKEINLTPALSQGEEGGATPSLPKNPISLPTEFAPALRYVDRATGNIYQTFVDQIAERKFTDTLIPKVYEAHFGLKGEVVVMRYLKSDEKTIQTFLGNLPKEVLGGDSLEKNEVRGSFLSENISDLSLSPDATKIFYLTPAGDGVVGTVMDLKTGKKIQVFDSTFTEWTSYWPSAKMITLATKPSYATAGHVYALNPDTKNFSRIFGDINGLTTLASPDGKMILWSNSNLRLNVYRIESRESTALGIQTLAEKCVWGRGSEILYCAAPKSATGFTYPDTWYQGEVSFSDEIWKVEVETGNTSLIADLSLVAEIDGVKLALGNGENLLFLVNKKDSYLWKLELE